jgi:hypothetical protein
MIALNPLNQTDYDYMQELVRRSKDADYVKVHCPEDDCIDGILDTDDPNIAIICETCMGQGFIFAKLWKKQ